LYIAFCLSAPFVLLLVAEIVARVVAEPAPTLQLFVRDVHPNLENEGIGEKVFEGDPLLAWKLKPNLDDAFWDYTVFSTNGDGIRSFVGSTEYGADDGPTVDPAIGRVLCMGDSVTFGYRVPVAFPGRPEQYDRGALPYPALLTASLNAGPEQPGRFQRPIQVYAPAVPGYTSHQGLAWLRREIGRYQPELVTLCYGWNDVDVRAMPDSESLPIDFLHVVARRCTASSRLLGRLSMWYADRRAAGAADGSGDKPAAPPTPVPRTSREQFAANMIAMADLARGRGANVVIVGTVYRDAKTNPAEARRITEWRAGLAAAARAAEVPYLEIPELTEAGAPGNSGLFGEVIHPNAAGHRLMAERLQAFIDERDLLPKRGEP
jgi:lysophospholipase L1-like esterase